MGSFDTKRTKTIFRHLLLIVTLYTPFSHQIMKMKDSVKKKSWLFFSYLYSTVETVWLLRHGDAFTFEKKEIDKGIERSCTQIRLIRCHIMRQNILHCETISKRRKNWVWTCETCRQIYLLT